MRHTQEQLKEMAETVLNEAGTPIYREFITTLALYAFGGNITEAYRSTWRLANA